jgi:hypothetical protein
MALSESRINFSISMTPSTSPKPRPSFVTISRRRFLASAALVPLIMLIPRAFAAGEGSETVIRDGWILRRDDLQRLAIS